MQRPYGAMFSQQEQLPMNNGQYGTTPAKQTTFSMLRRRNTLLSALVVLLVPWLSFTTIFGLLSFSMHYKHYALVWFIIVLFLGLTLLLGPSAYAAFRAQRSGGDPQRRAPWSAVMFATLALAWVLGVMFGSLNWTLNLKPYYEVTSLNMYPGVDPAKMHGEQVMDAGRVMFTRDAMLDVNQSIGFKSGDVYCVAPIVSPTVEKVASYDFWAVGMNCCSGDRPDFHCGKAFQSKTAHSGLRLMDPSKQKFYQLAVEQAEVAYKLNAHHPLFFTWLEDPIAVVNDGMEAGLKNFLLATLCSFSLQLFVVVMFALGFGRMPAS